MSRSNASGFMLGNVGERYVRIHLNRLLAHGIVTEGRNTSGDYIEGGDSRIQYNVFGEEVDMADFGLNGYIDVQGTGHRISRVLLGGLEVKTINSYTFRTNDNGEPSGTLPFELWNGDRYGWLFALLHPEMRLEGEKIHAVQPVLFCFLLVSYLGPYACVMFEDFPALAQRLNELAAEKGVQLAPLSEEYPLGIPAAVDAGTWRQDDPYIIDNSWHIPFERLSELATVTLVGEQPLIKHDYQLLATGKRYEELQEQRYAYLQQCACNRFMPAEERSKHDFYPLDNDHIFADVLENMETIAHLNQNHYPYLYEALNNRFMRTHLNCILLNMYSHPFATRLQNGMVCFLQGKSYLWKWGRQNNYPGGTFSWQSHLIFLTDADLLKKFVDLSKPVGEQMYRSVPQYTDEVLHRADMKAKAYIDAGIKLNNFTKSEVIKVSGQERADSLYFGDDRIISAMQGIVDRVFIDTAKKTIKENGYAWPEQVLDEVDTIINDRYWVDPFENHNTQSMNEREQALRQVKRIRNRYAELAIEIPCQFRLLSKTEKESFGISLHSRKRVYIQ